MQNEAQPVAAIPFTVVPQPDHVVAGLPADFTLAQLKETFTDEEIAAMDQGEDPVLSAPAPVAAAVVVDDDPAVPAPAVPVADPAPVIAAPPVQAVAPERPTLRDLTEEKAILAAAEAEKVAVLQKFQSGDLTEDEMTEQLTNTIQRAADAKAVIGQTEGTFQRNAEAYRETWNNTAYAYQQANPGLTDPAVFAEWDVALQHINSNPAYSTTSFEDRLRIAHTSLAAMRQAVGRPIAGPLAPKVETKPLQRTDPRPAAPVTLAEFSSGNLNQDDGSKFANIDRMVEAGRHEESEAAMAALTPFERAQYLAMD